MANYGTVDGADSYHLSAGTDTWTGTDAAKLAALVRASVYVDGLALRKRTNGSSYTMFSGVKALGRAQELAWPRIGAVDVDGSDIDSDVVPFEIEYATYEAALRELTTPGSLMPDYVPTTLIKREKVDVLETEYVAPTGDNPTSPVLGVVLSIIAPLLVKWGASDAGVLVV